MHDWSLRNTNIWAQTEVQCPECAGLMAEYERLIEIHRSTVDRLFAIGYKVSDVEHKNLKLATEVTRIRSEAARLRLEKHKALHPWAAASARGSSNGTGSAGADYGDEVEICTS
jgi:hypothetical protein